MLSCYFLEVLWRNFEVLISLFHNKVASRSLNYTKQTFENFIYSHNMSYNRIEILNIYF